MAWSYSSPSLASLATPTASYIKGLLDNLHADDGTLGANLNAAGNSIANALLIGSVGNGGYTSGLRLDRTGGAHYWGFTNGSDENLYIGRDAVNRGWWHSGGMAIVGDGSATGGLKLTRTSGAHNWCITQGLDESLYVTYDGSTVYSFTSAGVATKPSTSTWAIASDGRTKRNVAPFSDGLAAIKALSPVSYEYNGKAGTPDGVKGIGLIAQDAGSIPYCIETRRGKLTPSEPETDILNINYHALFLVLVNAFKEVDARLTAAGL